jgi:hypothetical protein
MTAPVLALPLVLWRLRRGPAADKPVMLLTLIGFVLFGGLALVQMRWSGEVQAVMLLPWTLTTVAIMHSEVALALGRSRVPLRAFGLGGALLLQMTPALIAPRATGLATTHPKSLCDWSRAAAALASSVPDGDIVMAPLWYGPEILWRSNARVIAGPYEMLPALQSTAAFWSGNEASALAVVQRRGIAHALVCRHDTGPGFGGDLAKGAHPAWLKQVPLINGPAEFRLYRVIR